ncbi:peptidyl-prolyl cis-trans isomerase 6-like [Petromyzon marinus]|uniref:Peptidyl-prolyl cis-trans isomerase n=1 Tax=Petromyzon marinus TaxID=7757 RepID=A0AAJ7UC16_PETMA|nr:peptidyl-prolyl cis-trans isomerase 6-like [Petromyzon marinus]
MGSLNAFQIALLCVLLAHKTVEAQGGLRTVTARVFLDVSVGGEPAGRVVLGLYGHTVPRTVENFVALADPTRGPRRGYKGSRLHRIIKGFAIQGGDFENGDGSAGFSIYGKHFDDENFRVKHSPFCIGMANSGENSNGSQFYITTAPTAWLNYRHVVFGRVLTGRHVVRVIEAVPTDENDVPVKEVVIVNCGIEESTAEDPETEGAQDL